MVSASKAQPIATDVAAVIYSLNGTPLTSAAVQYMARVKNGTNVPPAPTHTQTCTGPPTPHGHRQSGSARRSRWTGWKWALDVSSSESDALDRAPNTGTSQYRAPSPRKYYPDEAGVPLAHMVPSACASLPGCPRASHELLSGGGLCTVSLSGALFGWCPLLRTSAWPISRGLGFWCSEWVCFGQTSCRPTPSGRVAAR